MTDTEDTTTTHPTDADGLSDAETKLMLAAWNRRTRTPHVDTEEALRARVLEGGDNGELELSPAFSSLQARGWLVRDGARWTLSPAGIPEAQRLMRAAMCEGFGAGLIRSATSPTYVEYCRRVYGTDGFRFNMVDNPQLAKLLEVIGLAPRERFVDLGCAVGALTDVIAEHTGAHGTGIDFAAPAIEFAQKAYADKADRLSFAVGDLNRLTLPRDTFDVAVSIDTLYFVDDVEQVVGDILGLLRPGGRFAAFYSVTREDGEPDSGLDVDNTLLAKSLAALGIRWSSVDFTDNSRALWSRARQAAADLREAWEAEGGATIWQSRDREARAISAIYDDGRARRYLYWATV